MILLLGKEFAIKNNSKIYLSEVKMSWEDAAKAVERGDADVVPTFLANHQIDEEGTYEGITG